MKARKQSKRPYKRRKKVAFDNKGTFATNDKEIISHLKDHPMAKLTSIVDYEEPMASPPDEITITISKKRAARLSHDLADLLCWWQGFKAAVNLSNASGVDTDMAQNGIEASRDLNLMLKAKL